MSDRPASPAVRPPPDGFTFLGAWPATDRDCWFMDCPSCGEGVVAIVPAGRGWRLAVELGCILGDRCPPAEIAWCHLHQLGQLPPREPVNAGEAGRRYLFGTAKNAARRILAARDPAGRRRREAYELGRLAGGTGGDFLALARALAVAARHAGLPAEAAVPAIGTNLLAGTARPRARPR